MTKQFIIELCSKSKYLVMGIFFFIIIISMWVGLSWTVGWAVDKVTTAKLLNPSSYILYGTYFIGAGLVINILIFAVLGWILMAYKSARDKIHG